MIINKGINDLCNKNISRRKSYMKYFFGSCFTFTINLR